MAERVESSENLDDLPENLHAAAYQTMSAVQDWIADTSAQPWPGTRRQPMPDVRLAGNRLRLWFGDADSPVLELRPVELPRLAPGA